MAGSGLGFKVSDISLYVKPYSLDALSCTSNLGIFVRHKPLNMAGLVGRYM